jgi:hypothetical protein
MPNIQLLTSRQLVSAPFYGMCFELEDILAADCAAQLLHPEPHHLYKRSQQFKWAASGPASRLISKSTGMFRQLPEEQLLGANDDLNVLIVVAMNGRDLQTLRAIPQWRQRYDRVFAFIFDCWVLEAFPQEMTSQFDHLFVPFPEMRSPLADRFGIPVTVLPFGVDVRHHGSPQVERPIDITNYGRCSKAYCDAISRVFNEPGSERQNYLHPQMPLERFPTLPYGPERKDYQHKQRLGEMLRRSKSALAFSNVYTAKIQSTMQHHVAHRITTPILGYRWFEISAAGCAVLGKRPESPVTDEYLGWEDATIELPDDPSEGMEFIQDFLADKPRLEAIHHRNYYENLARNDWRHRIKVMFETLSIPLPEPLQQQLAAIDDESAAANYGKPIALTA